MMVEIHLINYMEVIIRGVRGEISENGGVLLVCNHPRPRAGGARFACSKTRLDAQLEHSKDFELAPAVVVFAVSTL